MEKLYTFAKNYCAKVGQESEEIRECCGGDKSRKWDIVHFDTRKKPAHTDAVRWMAMCDNNNLHAPSAARRLYVWKACLVSAPQQIRTEHVYMIFDTTDIRMEEIADHAMTENSMRLIVRASQTLHSRYGQWF